MNHIHKMIIAYDIFFLDTTVVTYVGYNLAVAMKFIFTTLDCLVFIFILVLPRFFLTLLHVKGF